MTTESEKQDGGQPRIVGKRFVFTGELDCASREDAEELIVKAGGLTQRKPTLFTDYVVLGQNPAKGKVEKCQKFHPRMLGQPYCMAGMRILVSGSISSL
eukprot:m.273944 g.273944  ORF g.273944 m.273944 type:complete len:99 (-) comp16283_c0_seq2:473-769(-)